MTLCPPYAPLIANIAISTAMHGDPMSIVWSFKDNQCPFETMVLTWQRRSVFQSWISLCLHKDLKEAAIQTFS
ncbi:hypothetical protein BYT27DRAFT_7203195 [Phlegmacium glaucopus]|nr:hypothetical protein BYT27DRAFT_7203195 [Phlegmacium glaucopus]